MLDTAKLEAMGLGELDTVTGLQTRDDAGWQAVVATVREEILEANRYDRWDSGPRERDAAVHELADSLVPTYTRELFGTLAIVGAAWGVDLEEARLEAGAYMNHSNVTFGGSMEDMARLSLYMAFRAAVLAVVATLDTNDGDDSDDDDD